MSPSQLSRLEYLNDMEFLTPDEHAEHASLLRMQSEMRQAFELLKESGMSPTWIAGEHIMVGNCTAQTLADAYRLTSCR